MLLISAVSFSVFGLNLFFQLVMPLPVTGGQMVVVVVT
jgi:hypothetical protein